MRELILILIGISEYMKGIDTDKQDKQKSNSIKIRTLRKNPLCIIELIRNHRAFTRKNILFATTQEMTKYLQGLVN